MKMINDNKLLLKIFSALIAIVLWFAVTYTEDPSINQHLNRLDTVFYNEDVLLRRGLIIVNKDELPSFSVTVRGRRSNVISSLKDVFASIDVSNITTAGEHQIEVDYIYPTDSVVLTKAKLSSVTVTAEKLVTREIPVKITAKPNKKSKDFIIESTSDVKTIKVSGAQSTVEKIALAVVWVDETDISSDCTTNYPFELFDENGNVLNERNIASKNHVTISVDHTLYDKVETNVNVRLSDELENYYTLDVTEQDVKKVFVGVEEGVEIDYLDAIFEKKHLDQDSETLTLTLSAPDGIYIPEDSKNINIKYNISKKAVFEVEVPVSAKNVPDGHSVSMTPDKIKVRIKSSKDDASVENITATLDARNLTRGARENAILTVTAKDNIQVLGTYTTSATLN